VGKLPGLEGQEERLLSAVGLLIKHAPRHASLKVPVPGGGGTYARRRGRHLTGYPRLVAYEWNVLTSDGSWLSM